MENSNQINLPVNALNEMLFIPFELNDDHDSHPLYNIDPDFRHFNSVTPGILSSNYYVEDSLNKKCEQLDVKSNPFSLMYMNIRSSSKNMDNFNMYLELLNVKFSIIGLSETWGNDSPIDMHTPKGYNTEHQSRSNKLGGGVTLLIKDSIQYTPRTVSVFNDNIKSVFIEIDIDDIHYDTPVIVGVVYRAPGFDVTTFNEEMNVILSEINNTNKYCYIMGDLNINLLNFDSHIPTAEFSEMIFSHYCMPLINKPIRVKSGSATLIDNIFTNKMSDNAYQGIMFTDITYHFPIFYINMNCKLSETATVITKRSINDKTIESLCNELATMSWDKVLVDNNVETAFSTFHGMFKSIYDKVFPLKRIKLNNYSNRKQWLLLGLKKSIKCKNKLYIKYMRHPTTPYEELYTKYRNNLHIILKEAEKDHYDVSFINSKSNIIKSWKIIKGIINKKKCSRIVNKFIINGVQTTNGKRIANGFNDFYVNIGPTLASELRNTDIDPTDYVKSINNTSTVFLEPVDKNEAGRIIKAF